MSQLRILVGDCIEEMDRMADASVQCCVTSPPYFGLRDYGHEGQIGLEGSPEEYVKKMVEVFRKVRRVLKPDGTVWLNLGDSYSRSQETNVPQTEHKTNSYPTHAKIGSNDGVTSRGERPGFRTSTLAPKQLIGIPWRVAFALQADGWYLRQDIIWNKPNAMPESVRDRCTKSHEYIFMLTKNARYYYDHEAIQEDAKTWTGRAATFDRGGNAVADHVIPGQSAAQHRPRKKQDELGKATYSGFNDRYDFDNPNPNPKRNKRSVWDVATKPYKGAHFATYPPALIEPCILAGSRRGDVVFDPFGGSGTTATVALQHGRRAVVCELNPDYVGLIKQRTAAALNDDTL